MNSQILKQLRKKFTRETLLESVESIEVQMMMVDGGQLQIQSLILMKETLVYLSS